MAEAFIRGLEAAGVPKEDILVSEPSEQRRVWVVENYGLAGLNDNAELVRRCSTIVLAIKPQIVKKVLAGISDAVDSKKLIITILAGVSTATIEQLLGGTPRVVRAMPNTPALVGAGAAAVCAGQFAETEDLPLATRLFELVGTVVQVEEGQLDAVTGLSGSGPAFVYTFIEALSAGGVQEGLRLDVAQALAVQTVLGAAQLVKQTGEHPALLREKVCSPGGTTIAAIRVLEERGLRATLMDAVGAATRRSKELGES